MNIKEKGRIEKIALDDITKTVSALERKRSDVINNFTQKPEKFSSEATGLLKKYSDNYNENMKIEKKLKGLKIRITSSGYSDEKTYSLTYDYGCYHPDLVKLIDPISEKIKQVESLKRDIVVDIYAGDADAKNFLIELGKKLSKLTS